MLARKIFLREKLYGVVLQKFGNVAELSAFGKEHDGVKLVAGVTAECVLGIYPNRDGPTIVSFSAGEDSVFHGRFVRSFESINCRERVEEPSGHGVIAANHRLVIFRQHAEADLGLLRLRFFPCARCPSENGGAIDDERCNSECFHELVNTSSLDVS